MAYDEHDFEKDLKDAVDEAVDDKMWEVYDREMRRYEKAKEQHEKWEESERKRKEEEWVRSDNIKAFERFSAADQAAIISYNEFKCAVESKCEFINREKTYRNRKKINSFRLSLWVICKCLFGIEFLCQSLVDFTNVHKIDWSNWSQDISLIKTLAFAAIFSVIIGWFVAYYPLLEEESGCVPFIQNIVLAVIMSIIYYTNDIVPWVLLIACQLLPFIIRLIRGNYKKAKKPWVGAPFLDGRLKVPYLDDIIKTRVYEKNKTGVYGRTGLAVENVKSWTESDTIIAAVDSVDWSPWTYDEKLRRSERKLMYTFKTANGDFAEETLEDCKRIPNRHRLINDFDWFGDIFLAMIPIALSYLLVSQHFKPAFIALLIWLFLISFQWNDMRKKQGLW